MTIFYHISKNNNRLIKSCNIDRIKIVCMLLTGFFLLQVVSPGAAFCLKEGNRVIQCRSPWTSPPPPVAKEVAETSCCNKTCKEKTPLDSQNHPSSGDNEKSSCCISLYVEHEGLVCLSFSDLDAPERVIFFDPIKPFFNPIGFPLNSTTEKPSSLVSLRSVVLIL